MSEQPKQTPPSTGILRHIPWKERIVHLIPFVIIILKLFHVRPVSGWAWKWVLSPFWILGIVGVIYMLGMGAIFYFASRVKK